MSALAEALLAAQRSAIGTLAKAYVAGAFEDDGDAGLIANLDRIGATDAVDQAQLRECLDVLRTFGVPLSATNGAAPKETRPASEAQWKLIRRLADERGQVAPEGPLTVDEASRLIEQLKALAALERAERDDAREAAAEREFWQDVGLEHAERVTLETARRSRC
jgi:hypothetical protein